MRFRFELLYLILLTLNQFDAQKCVFNHIKRSEFETNFYVCKLSSILDESQEVHLPFKSNNDVLVIKSDEDTVLGNLDIKFSEKFKNIEVVELRHAGIESISNSLFKDCNNLKMADFSGNKIQEIPEKLFLHSLKINEIALGGNKLVTLSENLFTNLTTLETLTLHDNKINFLPSKIFNTLGNLCELYLGNNKIKTLHSNLFNGLKKLETLYLNSNEITDLSKNIFLNLTNLKTLALNKNLLITIHSDSFGVLENLNYVDLSSNNISSVDEKFVDDTGVIVLMMQNNFCSNDNFQNKEEMKKMMKYCFENYTPREGKDD